MKLIYIFLAVLIFIATIAFLFGREAYTEKVMNGFPTPTPQKSDNKAYYTDECDAIEIVKPQAETATLNPVEVEVVVDNRDSTCKWTVFEAVAGSVAVEYEDGRILGSEILTTEGEWMTEGPTIYKATVNISNPDQNQDLYLVIRETNPSGIEEERSTIRIPLMLAN